jgi:hypothetical protein
MARKGYGRNSTLVNTTTHADDGTSPVGSNEWNENPKTDGIFGLTKSTQAISSNDIDVTDSYIEVSNAGDIYTLSAVTTSLPSTNYPSDSTSSISEGDLIYVVKAAGLGTVNLKHQNGGAGAGKITTLTAGDKALSATVPTILMARTIGSVLEWVEYGGGAVADSSITSTKIANDTILNEDINSSANIALSKLASDPLARAGHTGTQAASTISDFDTEVANNTAVAANTAKTGITSGQAGEITANTAKTGITSGQASAITANTAKISYSTTASNTVAANTTLLGATAGTVSASKALIVDSSKDLTGINDLTIAGDLTVNGTNTIINSTTLTVDDKNIEMGSVATPSDTTADGGGITLKGATDKTILWDNTNDNFTSSEHVNIADGKKFKINNVDTLTATGLGTNVVSSSLTSIGTLASGVLTGATGTAAGLTAGNATLAAGLSTPLAVASGGTTLTGFTAGDILYASSATALAKLAKGTTEQTLKMNSAATAPEWVTVAGAGATVLHKYSNSTQTTVFTVSANSIAYDVGTTVATQAAGAGQREVYIRKIDANNEGVFTIIHKNGALVEVQIA